MFGSVSYMTSLCSKLLWWDTKWIILGKVFGSEKLCLLCRVSSPIRDIFNFLEPFPTKQTWLGSNLYSKSLTVYWNKKNKKCKMKNATHCNSCIVTSHPNTMNHIHTLSSTVSDGDWQVPELWEGGGGILGVQENLFLGQTFVGNWANSPIIRFTK